MDVAAIDLAPPAIADFDLAVAGGGAVADDEMVGEAVGHAPDIAVVVIEDAGVALPGAAVVHDDEAPALAQDRGAIDLVADRTGKIVVAFPEQAEGQG